VTDSDLIAKEFEAHRTHLRAVAYRMLGSVDEADDAVQEAWLRLSRTDTSAVGNLGGWLTTVVSRVCLDLLRSRASRREQPLESHPGERAVGGPAAGHPEREAELADSVGQALLVVLDQLAPAERLAFVLHDLFAVPFDEIAGILDRSPAATRQLASRARRRVQGSEPEGEVDERRKRAVVDAFLKASRAGDFDALLALLDPDVVLRADATVVAFGAQAEARGPAAVAQTFAGRARAARLAMVEGAPGAVWVHAGSPRVVFGFSVADGRVTGIELMADPDLLTVLDLEMLED